MSTKKYKIGNSYPCSLCGKRFTIMETTIGAVLPIEWTNNERPDGDIYDPDKHTSHLLTCPKQTERKESWAKIQKKMEQAHWDFVNQSNKWMMR